MVAQGERENAASQEDDSSMGGKYTTFIIRALHWLITFFTAF